LRFRHTGFQTNYSLVYLKFQLQSPYQKIAITINDLIITCDTGRLIIRDRPSIKSPGFDVLGETSQICHGNSSFDPLTLVSTGNAIFI
ncbi:hypothetical protein PMAYCL1PPCAC_27538, partial [Pristionchus mayeri]